MNYDEVLRALAQVRDSLDAASSGLGTTAEAIAAESRSQLLPRHPGALPSSIGWQFVNQKVELMLSQYHDLNARLDTLMRWLEWRRREES
ncbi:MAG: hypothetical protein ABIH46_02405 [Chloroflexota bacterium]